MKSKQDRVTCAYWSDHPLSGGSGIRLPTSSNWKVDLIVTYVDSVSVTMAMWLHVR